MSSESVELDAPLEHWSRWAEREHGARLPMHVATNPIEVRSGPGGELWPAHAHTDHELLWGLSGSLTVRTETEAHVVSSGLGIWIPAQVAHEVHASTTSSFRCSWFSPAATAGYPGVVAFRPPPLLLDVLAYLMTLSGDEDRRVRGERFALDLLPSRPTLGARMPLPASADLRALTDALLDDPSTPVSVADWAHQAGVSIRTLTRRFHEETQMTVSQWRRVARTQCAIALLAQGQPVGQVARATGFSSTSAFSTTFRQVTGTTPRQAADLRNYVTDEEPIWGQRV